MNILHMFWVELWALRKDKLGVLTPVLQTVTLFGNRVSAEIINLQ